MSLQQSVTTKEIIEKTTVTSTKTGAFENSVNSINYSTYDSPTAGLFGPGSRPVRITSETRSLSGSSQSAAAFIRDVREREKKEISDLNDRFASYIEKVRFLDAQNRKMTSDVQLLTARMGKEKTSTKTMYEGEIAEAVKLTVKTKTEAEALRKQRGELDAELSEYKQRYDNALNSRAVDRKRIDDLIVKFTGVENEMNLLRRRVAELEGEVSDLKKVNNIYLNLQASLRSDIDQQSLSKIDYQSEAKMLLEEIEFLTRSQEQELSDLQGQAARDTTSENREYFRSELADAIRAIRAEYDQVMARYRADTESWYKLKIRDISTTTNRKSMEQSYAKKEVERLRAQLSDLQARVVTYEGKNSLLEKQTKDLRVQLEQEQKNYTLILEERDSSVRKLHEECEAHVIQMQDLLEKKASLEVEIATYRKLLDGEENRAGLRSLMSQVTKIEGSEKIEHERISQDGGETTNKTIFLGSAKGNISIQDAAVDGKYIILENTSSEKEENIGGWQVKRSVDSGPEVVFTFPKDFVLKPLKTVKIWAKDQGGENKPPEQIIFEGSDTFGWGINAKTVLVNTKGEERASHTQQTSQKTVIYA